jgi:hypothetical protein
MTFGEHRCHLVALGMRQPQADADPLAAIAQVFARHGIAAERPYQSNRGDFGASPRR